MSPTHFDMPDRPASGKPTAELLARYLAGELSVAERAAVRRQLEQHPELARALDRFVAALDAEDRRPEPPDAAASFAALTRRLRRADAQDALRDGATERPSSIEGRIGGSTPPAPLGRISASRPRRSAWRRRLGAGALIAAGLAGTLFYAARHDRSTPAPRTFVTAPGERADITLGDGTRVHLAPVSRLRVAADFGRERRDVYLDGEAYFEVEHDARRPFTVYAGNASARDLGTTFAVRALLADSVVEVAVRKGAVAMSGVGRLGAGDVGRLRADGESAVVHGADLTTALGWVDGRLQFTDASLARVLSDVRRWYGVDVVLSDSTLAALPFTGVLSDLTPSNAVALVAATLALRVQSDGGRIVLYPVPGRTPRPKGGMPSPRW